MKCVLCGATGVPMCDLKAERPATTLHHSTWAAIGPVCVSHCEQFDPKLGQFLEAELRKWESEHRMVGFSGAGQWSWQPRHFAELETVLAEPDLTPPDSLLTEIEARKKAQSDKMKAYWAAKRAEKGEVAAS